MITTPFVKAKYTGPPKRIGRFSVLQPGCIVFLTRSEWTTLVRAGADGPWEHLEDVLGGGEVQFPEIDPEKTKNDETENQQGDGTPEAKQDDDGEGSTVEEEEGSEDPEPKVDKRTTRAHEADGTFKADDPTTPDVDESQQQPEDAETETVPYEDCTAIILRDEIDRRNEEEDAGIDIPPRARKTTLIKLLEANDAE